MQALSLQNSIGYMNMKKIKPVLRSRFFFNKKISLSIIEIVPAAWYNYSDTNKQY